MNKRFFVFAATVIVLTGCASQHIQGAGPCDNPQNICIEVFVTKNSNNQWVITVDRERVKVRGQSRSIFWQMVNGPSQNYSFPTDGIFFKTDAGKQEFRCERQQATLFHCVDRGTPKSEYEYGIKLDGSPSVPIRDPWVINE